MGDLKSALMLTLLDRYLSKNFFIHFFSGLAVFMTLFLVIDFVSSLMRFDVGFSTLARYYGAYSFQICYQFVPVASMVGVAFTLSEMNRNKELSALFSLGVSLFRILTPIFFWILILFCFSFLLGDRLIPLTKQKRDYIYYTEMKKKPGLFSTVKTDKIWYKSGPVLFNIKLLDPEKSKAFEITFHYFSPDWQLEQLIYSKEAYIGKKSWLLKDLKSITFTENMTTPVVEQFETKEISVQEELSDIQSTSNASDFLSLKELAQYIKKNREAGLNMTRFEIDYYNKFSFPFTIFVLSIMVVPFIVGQGRSVGFSKNVFLIVSISFSFWTLHSFFISFGRYGYIHPIVATWTPHCLMLMVTGLCFYFRKT